MYYSTHNIYAYCTTSTINHGINFLLTWSGVILHSRQVSPSSNCTLTTLHPLHNLLEVSHTFSIDPLGALISHVNKVLTLKREWGWVYILTWRKTVTDINSVFHDDMLGDHHRCHKRAKSIIDANPYACLSWQQTLHQFSIILTLIWMCWNYSALFEQSVSAIHFYLCVYDMHTSCILQFFRLSKW